MTADRRPNLLAAALPIVAIVVFVLTVAGIVWSAGSTLGYDFHAYESAARRILDGQRLYDPAVDVAGGFAIYLYPPPFALAIVPLAIIGGQAAVGIWTGLMSAAFVGGIALLPVSRTVRWLVLLLGAIDWPVLYSIKLGQVGPILFLLFAIGWRWLDRPGRLGAAIGLGTIVKLQPGLLVGWAALTGRRRAIGIALAVIAVGAIVATVAAGTQPWVDYPGLLGRVSSPLTTPHNFTPGAVAFQAGVPLTAASVIQWASVVLALVAVVVAARTAAPDASYLVAVVASQLLSPLLWDHYAMLLLLPTAWLLARRQWWAIAIPLSTALPLIGIVPPAVYPIMFVACLLALLAVGSPRGRAMALDSAR
ncbi:MAG: glycosyltransferase family 87 protein [Candidatus Limnocylindrales bacterium]